MAFGQLRVILHEDICSLVKMAFKNAAGYLTGCGGADPRNSLPSASSSSLGYFSAYRIYSIRHHGVY